LKPLNCQKIDENNVQFTLLIGSILENFFFLDEKSKRGLFFGKMNDIIDRNVACEGKKNIYGMFHLKSVMSLPFFNAFYCIFTCHGHFSFQYRDISISG
jgi:hypothetical protein